MRAETKTPALQQENQERSNLRMSQSFPSNKGLSSKDAPSRNFIWPRKSVVSQLLPPASSNAQRENELIP